jgi:hypothetical protein
MGMIYLKEGNDWDEIERRMNSRRGGGKKEACTLMATVRFTSEKGRVKLIFV